jgi:hypothetical protein
MDGLLMSYYGLFLAKLTGAYSRLVNENIQLTNLSRIYAIGSRQAIHTITISNGSLSEYSSR